MAVYATQFSDLQAEVIDKVRLDATDDLARCKEWLNQRLVEVAITSRYFSGSASTTALAAGANTDALPGTIVELEYVTMTFGGQTWYLTPIGFDRMLQLRLSVSSGPPRFYSLRKGTVNLWPNAQGGEVMTYYGATVPDEMVSNSDVPGLPEPFASKLLIYGACIEAADFKNDFKLYFFYQQEYGNWMGQFMAFLNMRVTQASRAIPIYGPDGRPFDAAPFLPHDPSSDFWVTGWR